MRPYFIYFWTFSYTLVSFIFLCREAFDIRNENWRRWKNLKSYKIEKILNRINLRWPTSSFVGSDEETKISSKEKLGLWKVEVIYVYDTLSTVAGRKICYVRILARVRRVLDRGFGERNFCMVARKLEKFEAGRGYLGLWNSVSRFLS